jgi:uncharacterized membrane-anchored protein YitT (DUF2179 family)
MHPLWKKVLGSGIWTKVSSIQTLRSPARTFSHGKGMRSLQIQIKRLSLDFFMLSLGILSAGFGLKGFLLPNNFIDGGTVGISLLVSKVTGWSFSSLLIIINLPFILLGYRTIGKEFAFKTAFGILALSVAVAVLPYPQITADKLLVSVFGGFFLGAGIGLSVRGGGVIDGTEVMAINASRSLGLTIGDFILIINFFIFSVAAWLLSLETAMYSILTYLAASKTVNFIIEGIEEYTGVTIISIKTEEIRTMILSGLGRGVTIYKGEKGFGKREDENKEIDILYTVVTRLEVNQLNKEIEKIDPNAFVIMSSIKDTRGGMIKKRPLSH